MEVVRFERNEAIGQIVLANPPENLLNIRFSECLQQAVHEAGNSDIRVLLIRGPNFSQGGDILDFVDRDAHSFRSFVGEIHRSYRAIEALPIPTICAVRGAAYGGGLELVLACDLVVAAEDAVFFCLEASVGSAPLAGAVQRLAARWRRASGTLRIAQRKVLRGGGAADRHRQSLRPGSRCREHGSGARGETLAGADPILCRNSRLAEGLVGRWHSSG